MVACYLEKYFITLDHAQFAARAFFNRLGSLLDIAHLGIQHRVARLRLLINLFLRFNLAVELTYL